MDLKIKESAQEIQARLEDLIKSVAQEEGFIVSQLDADWQNYYGA